MAASSPFSRPIQRERSDACRNRLRALEAAETLFATHGVADVSMDQIAVAAGVGKATLYRAFGDRAGLAMALLDKRERDFQQDILSGPPPLGPGAAPIERIVAFLRTLAGLVSGQLDVLVCAETAAPGARFRSGVYVTHRTHLAMLITQVDPDVDAGMLAELMMAPVAAELVSHLATDSGQLADLLERIARGALSN